MEDGRAELSPSLEAGVAETDGEKTDHPERFDEPFESMKDDQEDILRAAFADDAQDPADSNETTDQGS